MPPDLDLRVLALVALGGALGATLRYVVSALLPRDAFPWGTFVVNLTGSVALGYLVFGDVAAGWLDPSTRVLLAVGVLGAYTTMSTFAVETVVLAEEGRLVLAAGNVVLNAGLSLLGAWVGRAAALLTLGGA